ncbi:helix-turn-helix transcriptional regulator [Bifidobacterium sp. ESL0690]|nr:helix-turn-helix transcriptional regulator [Bifidobacterium sp. ESL0690]WEV47699.1 helix-turn-helix transcriptional regulator [Bifidobacterium sp. ESL0690]
MRQRSCARKIKNTRHIFSFIESYQIICSHKIWFCQIKVFILTKLKRFAKNIGMANYLVKQMLPIRVAILLKNRSMSQKQLAAAIGLSDSTVSLKMNGRCSFTTTDLIKMADLFHVSTDYLLGREPMEVE